MRTTARQIPAERENRTIFPLLAKPVTRGQVILGKFAGCWLACGLALVVFYLFFGVVSGTREHHWPLLNFFQALWLQWVMLGVVVALVLLGSVVFTAPSSNATISFIVVLGILILGRYLNQVALQQPEPLRTRGLWALLPDPAPRMVRRAGPRHLRPEPGRLGGLRAGDALCAPLYGRVPAGRLAGVPPQAPERVKKFAPLTASSGSCCWPACFSLATLLQVRAPAGAERGQSDNVLNVLLGDGRHLFANQFFVQADVSFHSGYYPSIFDQAHAPKDTSHLTAKEGEPAARGA